MERVVRFRFPLHLSFYLLSPSLSLSLSRIEDAFRLKKKEERRRVQGVKDNWLPTSIRALEGSSQFVLHHWISHSALSSFPPSSCPLPPPRTSYPHHQPSTSSPLQIYSTAHSHLASTALGISVCMWLLVLRRNTSFIPINQPQIRTFVCSSTFCFLSSVLPYFLVLYISFSIKLLVESSVPIFIMSSSCLEQKVKIGPTAIFETWIRTFTALLIFGEEERELGWGRRTRLNLDWYKRNDGEVNGRKKWNEEKPEMSHGKESKKGSNGRILGADPRWWWGCYKLQQFFPVLPSFQRKEKWFVPRATSLLSHFLFYSSSSTIPGSYYMFQFKSLPSHNRVGSLKIHSEIGYTKKMYLMLTFLLSSFPISFLSPVLSLLLS